MQKGMLSPSFMRVHLGLAIALPSVSLLGVAAPALAAEDNPAAEVHETQAEAVQGHALPHRALGIARPLDTQSLANEPRSIHFHLSVAGVDMGTSQTPAEAERATGIEAENTTDRSPATLDIEDVGLLTSQTPTEAESAASTEAERATRIEAENTPDSALESAAAEADIFSQLPDADPEAPSEESATPDNDVPEAIEEAAPLPLESTNGSTTEADIPIPEERVLDDLQFLDPDPNPLLIQTQPEEVEIIGTQPITLEEALELSYRNNPDLQTALLELEQSEAGLREAQAANFPTVSVNGTLQGQNTTVAGDTELVPAPGGGFTFESDSNEELGISYSAQVDVAYNIFSSGQRAASIEAAAEQVQLSLLEVERRREELRLNTANEYYDLQQAIEAIRISQAFLEEAERNLQDTSLREEVGVGTRFDVLRAEVQVANARQDLVNSERARQVAQRALARRLNVPPSLTITTVPVDIAGDWPLSLEESIVLAYQNRAELEQQLTQRDINELLRRAELSILGPQVDLFANYSISDFLNQDDRFTDNYTFGARVSWTLFEGGAAQARARQRELDIEIAEQNFEETRNTIRLGVESAYYTLQSNQTNIGTARLAVTQAQEALDLAILRFDAGVGTQLDILNAQSELTDAEVNLVQGCQ